MKLVYEPIPHFGELISLHHNYSSKKDLGVLEKFCILFKNPRCNKGRKGGIHRLFQNMGKSEFGSLLAQWRMSPAAVSKWCWTQMCFLFLFPYTYS